MKPFRKPLKVSFAALALALGGCVYAQADTHRHKGHSDTSFAQREQEVMPFDLEATLHTFQETPWGGRQRVTVKNSKDVRNTALIRSHLKEEEWRFAHGDFSDPAYLHGEDMPGLVTLQEAAASGALRVSYQELVNGAQLTFKAEDAAVIEALHAWFEAQVADHGAHATIAE